LEQIAWITLDTAYFDAARRQLAIFEEDLRKPEFENPGRRLFWGTALAGASMAMVCAAMDAHANYLITRSAKGQFPNLLHLSEEEAAVRCKTSDSKGKWMYACRLLIGRPILSDKRDPFKGFCTALWRRNHFVMHPKLVPIQVAGGIESITADDFEELRQVNIENAREAIAAAQGVIRLVYEGLDLDPPGWAQTD
jgi:hypothetical protein